MRKTLLAAVVFALGAVELSGGEWQYAATEAGRPVVRCAIRGRITGHLWRPYTCARGNETWVPVPYNPGK